MTTNPFISPTRIAIEESDRFINGAREAVNPFGEETGRLGGEPGWLERNRPFLKRVGYFSVLFLVVIFSVFREVKHSHDLFRMSQMVAAADVERRQWQERERLDEARSAYLAAEVFRLESLLPRDAKTGKSTGHTPARRR